MSEKTPEREDEALSEPSSGEFLAKTRARRSNAGARMASLIDEEADDELALLFAEQEDDEDFELEEEERRRTADEGMEEGEGDGGDENDEEMSDDDDEEDQGPNVVQDDYEGEKELQRQAREERRAQKRKAQENLRFATLRKKVRIDQPTPRQGVRTPTIPAPRPRKKSERISWLPTPEDGPTRSSSRRQTMENKEQIHARLKEGAEKRERTIRMMQAAAEKKAKMPPKIMTQEDRLREAKKTEKLNMKSLNRWEEMEKKKAEEQKAKLLALQNRRLEGPVMTWWSGIAKWINDKLVQVGHKELAQTSDDATSKKRKPKASTNQDKPKEEKDQHSTEEAGMQPEPQSQPAPETQTVTTAEEPTKIDASITKTRIPLEPPAPAKTPTAQVPEDPKPPAATGGTGAFLDGIQLYASMNETPASAPPPSESTNPPAIGPVSEHNVPPQSTSRPLNDIPTPNASPTQSQQPSSDSQSKPAVLPPPKIELSSRTAIILQEFDDLTAEERGEYNIFYNPRKAPKLQKPPTELCPITSLPARYRDPQTGLGYANALAYREIRHLVSNRYAWSSLLGCFVGPIGVGARGVPERFLAPNAAPQLDMSVTAPSAPAPTPTAAIVSGRPVPGVSGTSGSGDVVGGVSGSG
ncbi:hypothetical protein VTO42DRAFT_8838 [Malbranchea cinnamomea]